MRVQNTTFKRMECASYMVLIASDKRKQDLISSVVNYIHNGVFIRVWQREVGDEKQCFAHWDCRCPCSQLFWSIWLLVFSTVSESGKNILQPLGGYRAPTLTTSAWPFTYMQPSSYRLSGTTWWCDSTPSSCFTACPFQLQAWRM